MKFIKNFRKDEDGAVTVDWVVLTAAVVGLAGDIHVADIAITGPGVATHLQRLAATVHQPRLRVGHQGFHRHGLDNTHILVRHLGAR